MLQVNDRNAHAEQASTKDYRLVKTLGGVCPVLRGAGTNVRHPDSNGPERYRVIGGIAL